MRYLMMHKTNARNEAGHLPPPEMIAAMGRLIGQMAKDGVMVAAEGLRPSSQGVRLNFSNGKCTVTPGPLEGGNELIAGFAILRAGSLEEAIGWAKRFAAVVGDVEIDVRPVTEPWDLGVMPRPEGLASVRFMAAHKADRNSESGAPPSPGTIAGMGRLIEEMKAAGVLVTTLGLAPSSQGARIRYHKGRRTVIDGPFAESKELIAGFVVLEVASREEAIERSGPFAAIVGDVEIDLLPIGGMASA